MTFLGHSTKTEAILANWDLLPEDYRKILMLVGIKPKEDF